MRHCEGRRQVSRQSLIHPVGGAFYTRKTRILPCRAPEAGKAGNSSAPHAIKRKNQSMPTAMPYVFGNVDFPPRLRGFGSIPTRGSRASTSAVILAAMVSNAGSSCGT
ncbi:hypothetical protein AYM40_09650 [Paraburkholderia phytofirmans OLGA172]|uniref:Uncharacterized protein n=1 Tax=Paraburkholderia phytofirmans OLGA172 TaxID=1417228 RepID=A0A160FJQ5_9BURK|nr:hypothetical protein AYM40_09650 [Paraburkholderia phytofirmans OLGA172]